MPPKLPANLPKGAQDLGDFIEHFPTSVGGWRFIAPIGFVGLGALFLGVPIAALKEGVGVAVLALVLPGFFFGVAVAVYLYLRRLRRMQAWLFADGLAAANASRVVTWHWYELALVWRKTVNQLGGGSSALEGAISGALEAATRASGGWIVLTLESRDGTRIRLSGLSHANRLVEAIERETLPRLLPPAQVRYDRGEVVFFGRLGLSRKGVHDGTAVLHWGEVKDVKRTDTAAAIFRKGKWLSWSKVPLAKIPNVHVFFALAREVQSRQ
jgi:hypothetical protein